MSSSASGVYFYTGEETDVPRNVTHIQLDPSVKVIPNHIFSGLYKLEEVDLGCNNGNNNEYHLQEIGNYSFSHCARLKRIVIPPTVHTIGEGAFSHCQALEEVVFYEGGGPIESIKECTFRACRALKRCTVPSTVKTIGYHAFRAILVPLDLPDSVETIENVAFNECKFTNFRIPPLVDEINRKVFYSCRRMFSLELPEQLSCIRDFAFRDCFSLRNLAIPNSASVVEQFIDDDENGMDEGSNCFHGCKDLIKLFGSTEDVRDALKKRFDGLPIHKLCYYQSYHKTETTIERLVKVLESAHHDKSSYNQDCIGMTPLHILACSRNQNMKLYKLIVASQHRYLITKDRWGCLPIFYALLGSAPDTILNFLVDSHASFFPDHVLNVESMIKYLTSYGASSETTTFLLGIQKHKIFPNHHVDWDQFVSDMATALDDAGQRVKQAHVDTFRILLYFSISKRVRKIGIKQWRESIRVQARGITNQTRPWKMGLEEIRRKLVCAECAYEELMEATSILEMALWKAKINETNLILHIRGKMRRSKALKVNKSSLLGRCRVNSGAEVVIVNVLPFLVSDI